MIPMKDSSLSDYSKERNSLTKEQIDELIESGKNLALKADLVSCLINRGSAIFPHTYITKCGDQIAAVAYASLVACQKSRKKLLVLGVLHPLTATLKDAKIKALKNTDLSKNPCKGFFGPGLPHEDLLAKEFSLDNFIFLITQIAKKEHCKVPEMIIRYPNLLSGNFNDIEGVEELKGNYVVVATSDLCHHGVAYGMKNSLPISKEAVHFAYTTIEKGLKLFEKDDIMTIGKYAQDSFSDSVYVSPLLRFILGPLEGSICDLKLVDVSDLFEGNPQPSWVAATLVKLKPKK